MFTKKHLASQNKSNSEDFYKRKYFIYKKKYLTLKQKIEKLNFYIIINN